MTTLPLADARAQLSKLVDSAMATHERFDITRNGRRAAVLLSADDYDSLTETLEILGDPETLTAIREGLDDAAAGRFADNDEIKARYGVE
jgi:prevent-host-death family protein